MSWVGTTLTMRPSTTTRSTQGHQVPFERFDVHSELTFQLFEKSSEFTTGFGISHGVGALEAFSSCGHRFLWFAFFGEDLRDLEPRVRLLFIPLQAGVESLTGFRKSREPSKFDAEGVPTKGSLGSASIKARIADSLGTQSFYGRRFRAVSATD